MKLIALTEQYCYEGSELLLGFSLNCRQEAAEMRVENRFYLTVRRKSCKVKDKLQRMLYKSMCDKNKNKKTITNRFVTGHKMGSTTRGVFFFMSFLFKKIENGVMV